MAQSRVIADLKTLPFKVVYFPSRAREGGEDDVERINQFAIYELGRGLKQFVSYQGNVRADTCMHDLFAVRGALSNLLEGKPFPIIFSRAATVALKEVIEQMFTTHFEVEGEGGARVFRWPTPQDAMAQEIGAVIKTQGGVQPSLIAGVSATS